MCYPYIDELQWLRTGYGKREVLKTDQKEFLVPILTMLENNASEEQMIQCLEENLRQLPPDHDIQLQLKECIRQCLARMAEDQPYLMDFLPEKIVDVSSGDLDYMFRDTAERLLRMGRVARKLRGPEQKTGRFVCRYVAENIDQEIRLAQLSTVLCMNKKYLSTLLHAQLGMTFNRYLRLVQIERAKKLLCDTDCRVYEVAELLHFKDTEYFSRVFKEETGISPSAYVWFPRDDLFAEVCAPAQDTGEIVIGVIGAYSGSCAYLETGKQRIYAYAAQEINRNGGIAGRPVRLVFQDYQSDLSLVRQATETLLTQNPAVVMGGFLSSAREIIRPILDENRCLYIYDSLYEGGLADHYTFCTSTMPEQNLFPVIQFMLAQHKTTFYILATDYNYGILSCESAKAYIGRSGGRVLATEYVPNCKSNFSITIENVRELKPDVVITFLVGRDQSAFFEQWHTSGDPSTAIITTSAISQEYMHLTTPCGTMENVYFATPYCEELDTPAAVAWTNQVRHQYSRRELPYLGSDHEAAYLSMYLYKSAVEACSSTKTEAVIRALEKGNLKFQMPGGPAVLNPRDHHMIRDICICRVDSHNRVRIVQRMPHVKSLFVETVLQEKFRVKEGLRELGKKAPNLQYNEMIYKI